MGKKRVFLGGTCNGSEWRSHMIHHLDNAGLDYFNPVVADWNEEAQANELRERETCDYCLYVITPKKTGDYAVAEVVDDSNKRPEKTVLVLLREDDVAYFDDKQWKLLGAVAGLVKRNGGRVCHNLKNAAYRMSEEPVESGDE